MKHGPTVDFGKVAGDYGRHRQGFPPAFFERLEGFGIGRGNQSILDIGTGTGLLARAFARQGCLVTGLDPSTALLNQARQADARENTAIIYAAGKAEQPPFRAASFDVVSAASCWHWFDRKQAAAEAKRLLTPAGKLLIAHLDWLRLPGNVIDITAATIHRYSPGKFDRPMTFLYPAWLGDLTDTGFTGFEAFAFSTKLIYSQEAWRGRIRASARVGPMMDKATLQRFDADLTETLSNNFASAALKVDHRVFALIAR